MADADGVADGVGDGDPVGLDDGLREPEGLDEAEDDRAGEPEGLAEGEGLGEGEPEGLAAGDGDALADGVGVTGGVGEGVGVGSSAFAYAGNMARSARPNTAPSRNVRNIHRKGCPRALIHRTQVLLTDERSATPSRAYFGSAMNQKQQFAAVGAVVTVILVGILLFATRLQTPPAAIATATATATATPSATPTVSLPTTVTPTALPTVVPSAVLTGSLGYPSDFIPPLTVYAISVADQRMFFSVDTPRYPLATNTPPRPSYTMTGVAPGTYYVLAYRNDDVNVEAKDAPGVYSQYVLQCLQPNAAGSTPAPGCSSSDHSLVQVTVRAGETVPRIDVTDWYYGPARPSYPPRPR